MKNKILIFLLFLSYCVNGQTIQGTEKFRIQDGDTIWYPTVNTVVQGASLGTMSQGTQYPDNLSVKTFADSTDAKITRLPTANFVSANLTATAARTHTLVDNTSTALSLGSTGATGLFQITTTDAAESVNLLTTNASASVQIGNTTNTFGLVNLDAGTSKTQFFRVQSLDAQVTDLFVINGGTPSGALRGLNLTLASASSINPMSVANSTSNGGINNLYTANGGFIGDLRRFSNISNAEWGNGASSLFTNAYSYKIGYGASGASISQDSFLTITRTAQLMFGTSAGGSPVAKVHFKSGVGTNANLLRLEGVSWDSTTTRPLSITAAGDVRVNNQIDYPKYLASTTTHTITPSHGKFYVEDGNAGPYTTLLSTTSIPIGTTIELKFYRCSVNNLIVDSSSGGFIDTDPTSAASTVTYNINGASQKFTWDGINWHLH